jgi:hypothetical protein
MITLALAAERHYFPRHMKIHMFDVLIVLSLALLFGCKATLGTTAAPTSYPVTVGVATTNDAAAVAWEKVALAANAQLNPTPTTPLVSTIITALIAITAAAAGAYTHKSGVQSGTANAAATTAADKKV